VHVNIYGSWQKNYVLSPSKGRKSCCIILRIKNLHIIPMIDNRQILVIISKNGLGKPNWNILGCGQSWISKYTRASS